MVIDCDTCEVRGLACGDCVVTVILGTRTTGTRTSTGSPADVVDAGTVEVDVDEARAIAVLADSGLVPPLRLVPGAGDSSPSDHKHGERPRRAM